MTSMFKKYRNRIRIINWYWYVINGRKKELEEEYDIQYTNMQQQIINIWKTMAKTESSYFTYLDANDLYGYSMSQILPVDGFEWRKTCQNLMKKLWSKQWYRIYA